MNTPGLMSWIKRPDIESVLISIFFELSDLKGFGCDLSDSQGGLKCWRMAFTFCGKHPLLLIRIQVSDPGPMGPLVFCSCASLSRHGIKFSF